MATQLGNVTVKLTADTTEFHDELDRLKARIDEVTTSRVLTAHEVIELVRAHIISHDEARIALGFCPLSEG